MAKKLKAQVIQKSKENKPMGETIYDKMPEELQTELDAMVNNYSTLKDIVLKVVELGKKFDFTVEELSVVVRYKLAQIGVSSTTIFRQLANLQGEKKKTEKKTKADEDAEDEAKEQVANDVGYIDLNLSEIDVDAIIRELKVNKKARIYFSKTTSEFVKIEFMKK